MSILTEQRERDLRAAIEDMECECAEEHVEAFDELLARLEAAEGEGARLREAAEFLLNSLNSSTVAHHAWEQVGSAARGLREALFAQSEGLPS